jgi:hypothetical protein
MHEHTGFAFINGTAGMFTGDVLCETKPFCLLNLLAHRSYLHVAPIEPLSSFFSRSNRILSWPCLTSDA